MNFEPIFAQVRNCFEMVSAEYNPVISRDESFLTLEFAEVISGNWTVHYKAVFCLLGYDATPNKGAYGALGCDFIVGDSKPFIEDERYTAQYMRDTLSFFQSILTSKRFITIIQHSSNVRELRIEFETDFYGYNEKYKVWNTRTSFLSMLALRIKNLYFTAPETKVIRPSFCVSSDELIDVQIFRTT